MRVEPLIAREDSYGHLKRLDFISHAIRESAPADVLDFGCGTGALLTTPLAQAFPECRFVGVDSDARTVAEANAQNTLPNLSFLQALPETERFDVIIASEVLEHVDEPAGLIDNLRQRLLDGGRLIVTVPNGRGPFEAAAFGLGVLRMLHIYPVLHAMVRAGRRLRGRTPGVAATHVLPMTLADSPHVQFYTLRDIRRLLTRAGFGIEQIANRTFVCGFIWDRLVDRFGLAPWNARVADRLPRWAVSDWMLVLRVAPPDEAQPAYRPSLRTRIQRHVASLQD